MNALRAVLFCFTIMSVFAAIAPKKSEAASWGQEIKLKVASFIQGDRYLVTPNFSPAEPKTGENVTVFIDVKSKYGSPDPVKTFEIGQLDGAVIPLLNPADTLWIARLGAFQSISTHTLTIETYIEDESESRQARDSISLLSSQISNLQNQLAHEQDPIVRQQLQAQIASKTTQRTIFEQFT